MPQSRPRIAVAPDTRSDMYAAFVDAARAGGGDVVPVEEAEALVWADPARASAFPEIIRRGRDVRWVQLPYAGIEPFVEHLDPALVWTCGKGVYARPVAEHALGLMLAGLRGLGVYARADRWRDPIGRNLLGAAVTIVGGGGICDEVVALMEPFQCDVTVVRRTPTGDAGHRRLERPIDEILDAVASADVVVLALALTPATKGIVDTSVLDAMAPHAWLVNVARGAHVVTNDLVDALRAGRIGGAALDVTDPEPLPQGHPLWTLPNCIITPHVANTPEMGLPLIAARVKENVAHFGRGEPLVGLVDASLGY